MWTEIANQVAALSPGVLASVNPPADPDAIGTLERRIGAPLPDGFKQYLAVMDGQNDLGRDHPFIGFNRLLPVARIIETMDMAGRRCLPWNVGRTSARSSTLRPGTPQINSPLRRYGFCGSAIGSLRRDRALPRHDRCVSGAGPLLPRRRREPPHGHGARAVTAAGSNSAL